MKRILYWIMIAGAATFASCNYDELNDALEHAIERSWYGNWCGPMHSGQLLDDGIDSLDDLCKAHDICYSDNKVAGDQYYNCTPDAKLTCDQTFVTGLEGLETNPLDWDRKPPSGREDEAAQFRIDAIKLFGGCVDLFAP